MQFFGEKHPDDNDAGACKDEESEGRVDSNGDGGSNKADGHNN